MVKRASVPDMYGMDLRSEFRMQEAYNDDEGFSFDEPKKKTEPKAKSKPEKLERKQQRAVKRKSRPFSFR